MLVAVRVMALSVFGTLLVTAASAEERRLPSDPIERVKVPRASAQDQARRAIDHAKNDPTLRMGDIISTERGFLQFKGRIDAEREDKDFIPARR